LDGPARDRRDTDHPSLGRHPSFRDFIRCRSVRAILQTISIDVAINLLCIITLAVLNIIFRL